MECHTSEPVERDKEKIVIVGNPNVGKSVIFGLLTGRYATVSNYPGTTVTITSGTYHSEGKTFQIIDTPGANSLIPMSEDEVVTRNILMDGSINLVVQVADAKNLKRGLLITVQLAEMGLPYILVLNMWDEALNRGIEIDVKKLSSLLNTSVIPTIGIERKGLRELKEEIKRKKRISPFMDINYGEDIETGIKKIEPLLPESHISRRSLSLMLLAGDESLRPWLEKNLTSEMIGRIEAIRQEIQARFAEPLGFIINQIRLRECEKIIEQVMIATPRTGGSLANKLGNLMIHPLWGIPILMVILFFMYEFVGVLGAQIFVDFLEDNIFGQFITPLMTSIMEKITTDQFFIDFMVGQYGIVSMAITYSIAIILPIVGTFFIAFGILEDSGYLPRLAVMVHKVFKLMGLHGKAVLPMVLGLGCDTMATLTARIMETRKERILVTLLLALGVPCSAQLGVILGMLGGISVLASIIWASVVILVLFLTGLIASRILKGEESDFVFDIPPLRIPSLRNILLKTLLRMKWYIKEAVPLFIIGTIILFTLDKLGLLRVIEEIASPVVVNFLGLPAQATEAFIVGFLRRDYGAAGLYALASAGKMTPNQIVVSLVTITLFVPCIANFLVMIKERGIKTAMAIVAFIFPFAFLVGGMVNFVLNLFHIRL